MATNLERHPVTDRHTLTLALDLRTGDKLARQIDNLRTGTRVDITAITTPRAQNNGKLLVSGTRLQLGVFL